MEPTSDPVSPQAPVVLKGRCLCGMVEYESLTLPLIVTLCHCTSCRKASGAPFLSFGLYHNTALKWRSPVPHKDPPIKVSESPVTLEASSIAVRGSCGDCGTPLFMKYHCRPDGTSVVMGIVDDEHVVGEMPRPKEHIFLKEKARWWSIPDGDGLARHEGFTEPYQARLKDWVSRGAPRRADV